MNDLLVVELIFQFAPLGRIDSFLSIQKNTSWNISYL